MPEQLRYCYDRSDGRCQTALLWYGTRASLMDLLVRLFLVALISASSDVLLATTQAE